MMVGKFNLIILYSFLFSVDVFADYKTESENIGGKTVHNIIASADTCDIYKIKLKSSALVDGYDIVEGPAKTDFEAKHMLTQLIGLIASRGKKPQETSIPDHLIRFCKGKECADVLVSSIDGIFSIMYKDKIVSTLGELQFAVNFKFWVGFTFHPEQVETLMEELRKHKQKNPIHLSNQGQ